MSKQDTTNQRRERTPNNRTTTGYRISDELWEVLQPLLPTHVNTHRKGFGRPRTPDRDCADAIFYVLRTGWKSASVGSDRVVCALDGARSLSRMGVSRGLPAPLWQAGVEGFEELCGIDWQWFSMDGAMRHPRPWAGKKPAPILPTAARAA